jgi:hypothetical protein
MPVVKTASGWQVVSLDGTQKMSPENLTLEQARAREVEERERHPLLLWARDRGLMVKP